MQVLIAILLYLRAIAPGTYTQAEIDLRVKQHSIAIESVKSDEVQMDIIQNQYLPEAEGVIVISTSQED